MGTGRWKVWAAAWMLVGAMAPGLAWGDAADALPKGKWLLMADCASRNEAIGIARMYQQGDPDRDFGIQQGALASPSVPTTPDTNQPRVVSTDRGRFEVVFGPFSDADISAGPPAGISLTGRNKGTVSDGDGFVATVWQVRRHVLAAASFKGREAGTLQSGDLTISIRTVPAPGSVPAGPVADSQAYQRIEVGVRERGGTVLSQVFDYPTDIAAQDDVFVAYLVWLDRNAVRPQIVIQRPWMRGLVNTLILTERMAGRLEAVWAWTYADSGYEFDDLLSDGTAQIVGRDLPFFTAIELNKYLDGPKVADLHIIPATSWMAYAGQTASEFHKFSTLIPLAIYSLNGTVLQPLGGNQVIRDRVVQDLAGLEYIVRDARASSLRDSNWFLISWVTKKAWLSEGHDGWSRMLRLYDPWYDGVAGSDGAGEPSFPEKLRTFLVTMNYGPFTDLPMSGPATAANADRAGPLGDETVMLVQPKRFLVSATPASPWSLAATLVAPHRFLTFGHLVEGCASIALKVQTGIGSAVELPAKIVAHDQALDLVLLGLDDDSSVFASTGPSFAPDPPDRTPVVGYGPSAGAAEAQVNFAVGRTTPGLTGNRRQFRAFDALNLLAGAGGPLLDDRGRLVGIADGGFDPNWPGGDLHESNLALRASLIRQFLVGAGVPYAFDLHAPKLSREAVQRRAVNVTARLVCPK